MKKIILTAAALMCSAVVSWGDIIPTFQTSVDNGDATFTYFYTADLTDVQRLDPANGSQNHFFVIFDFNGYVAGSALSLNPLFTPGDALVGPYPDALASSPDDDPTVPNIYFRYNGAAVQPGPASLGQFSAISTLSTYTTDRYFGQATKNNGIVGEDGTLTANTGIITTPAPASVPEPGSIFLMGSGLLGVAMFVRRRVSN
jgi:hypothetical protein